MKNKLKSWIKSTPDRKVYIEVITALLTVPVMITVLLTNFNNLTKSKEAESKSPEPTAKQEIVIKQVPDNTTPKAGASAVTQPTQASCKKEVGPVTISYPQEGASVSDNPLNIIIKYDDSTYCSVVWSYRINGGAWSEYSGNSISLYDMPSGDKKFDLRIQSTVSQDSDMISRSFIYNSTNSQTATPSAN